MTLNSLDPAQVFLSSSSGLSLEGFVAAMLPPQQSSRTPGTPLELSRRRGSSSFPADGAPHATRRSRRSSSLGNDDEPHGAVARMGRRGRRKRSKRRKQPALAAVPRIVHADAHTVTTTAPSAATTAATTTAGRDTATLVVGGGRRSSRASRGKIRRSQGGRLRSSRGGGDDQASTERVGTVARFQSEMEKVGVVTDLVELFQQVKKKNIFLQVILCFLCFVCSTRTSVVRYCLPCHISYHGGRCPL